MSESAKLDFRRRRIRQIGDVTDLVEMFFPGNPNQQHAAARILLALKGAPGLVRSLGDLERRYRISRRTLQRTRAKLAEFGLIEHVTWMNRRYGGLTGWKLSGQMSTALRQLADKIDLWRSDMRSAAREKEEALILLLCGSRRTARKRDRTFLATDAGDAAEHEESSEPKSI
jgi:hypothetical protein